MSLFPAMAGLLLVGPALTLPLPPVSPTSTTVELQTEHIRGLRGVRKIVVADLRRAYALLTDDHSLVVFDNDFQPIRRIGSIGNRPGEFFNLYEISLGISGRIAVTEVGNDRIQILDPEGSSLHVIPFRRPESAAFADQNTVAALSLDNAGTVFLFGLDGTLRGRVGGAVHFKGASQALDNAMNRGRVVSDRGEPGFFAFAHGVFPPRIRRFSPSGKMLQEIELEGKQIRPAIDFAQEQMAGHIQNHTVGYVDLLTSVRRHPITKQIWVAFYRGFLRSYSASGEELKTYHIRGPDGAELAFTDFDFIGDNDVLFVFADELYRGHFDPIPKTIP